MKRLLGLLCLCLLLAGCQEVPGTTEPATYPTTQPTSPATEPTTIPTQEPTTAPTEAEVLVPELPMSAIVLTFQQELSADDGKDTVFSYTYQDVRLYLTDEAVSEAVTLELLNRIDSTRDQAQATEQSGGSTYAITYTPTRIDSGILSLSGVAHSLSGGQPMTACTAVTYDLLTGQVLSLHDVLTDRADAQTLCVLVCDALEASDLASRLYSDYAVTVENRFSQDFEILEGWYLSGEGLCFDFAPYELAPNSLGIVTATVPYDQLFGILEDAWFPVERISAQGSLAVEAYTEADQARFDRYAEVVLDPDGAMFLLQAQGLVYDLVLETGVWSPDGSVFTPDARVFAGDHLTPGEALLVQLEIPDTLPSLRITYTTDAGTKQMFLTLSGEDGAPLLIEY